MLPYHVLKPYQDKLYSQLWYCKQLPMISDVIGEIIKHFMHVGVLQVKYWGSQDVAFRIANCIQIKQIWRNESGGVKKITPHCNTLFLWLDKTYTVTDYKSYDPCYSIILSNPVQSENKIIFDLLQERYLRMENYASYNVVLKL